MPHDLLKIKLRILYYVQTISKIRKTRKTFMIKLVGETWYQNPDKSRQKNTKDHKFQTIPDNFRQFQTIPDFLRKMQLFQTNPDRWEP